jgi:hypothetical protein
MAQLCDTILKLMKAEFAKEEPKWHPIALHTTDYAFLKKECLKDSEFDTLNVRKRMFESMNHTNHIVKKCAFGQVLAVYETDNQKNEIPWGLWGRILRMYSEQKKKPFKVFFLANSTLRQFPPLKKPITPLNINGGYTYPCNPETIVIYRAEDATRVLIHELMHSCCLDNHANGVDRVEAETEAWAELLYVGFLSKGHTPLFHKLLHNQSAWIIGQNKEVQKHMKTQMQFPWRYTIGKEEVWKRWNILQHMQHITVNSLRLTCPPSNEIKKAFGVTPMSTIL